MRCHKCSNDTEVKDTRTLETNIGVCFVRRIRYCPKKHKTITHEILADHSAIPDIYRNKRVRKSKVKSKPKKQNKEEWLTRILSQLD